MLNLAMIKTVLARSKRKLIQAFFHATDFFTDADDYIKYTYFQNGYNNPNYRFSEDQIAFIHLPKTAGSSLASLLRNDTHNTFINLDIHKPISIHNSVYKYKYITILREPVERVWSYYQMVLRSGNEYPYRKYAIQGLETFLQKSWAARNWTTRYIAGDSYAEPTQNSLEFAKTNIDQFYQVFLFGEFENQVSKFLSSHEIRFQSIPNIGESNYRLPDHKEKVLIEEYNRLDAELFKYWSDKDNTQ